MPIYAHRQVILNSDQEIESRLIEIMKIELGRFGRIMGKCVIRRFYDKIILIILRKKMILDLSQLVDLWYLMVCKLYHVVRIFQNVWFGFKRLPDDFYLNYGYTLAMEFVFGTLVTIKCTNLMFYLNIWMCIREYAIQIPRDQKSLSPNRIYIRPPQDVHEIYCHRMP